MQLFDEKLNKPAQSAGNIHNDEPSSPEIRKIESD